VRPDVALFRVGAFVALLLVVRHVKRMEGGRAAGILVAYLTAMAIVREWVVAGLSHAIDEPRPYTPDPTLGHLGLVNVVVVAGWVFCALVSFALAKMIQRRNFPGTNVFFTLALIALVTTAISYPVEVTGMRIHLWTWHALHPVVWLPFEWPFDAFEGWAATSFMIMLVYCAVRYRLFSPDPVRRAAVTAGLLLLFGLADLAQPWLGPESPRKKVTVVYLTLSVVLGFAAPRKWLGTSAESLGPRLT
jgi:hypothetical protein